jgi:hypothetical protein
METQEQTFGRESVERAAGFIPASVDLPTEEPQGDISIQETELRDAANEIAKARNERQREIESKPFDAEVQVQDTAGRKLPEEQTLTPEEASWLVTGARNKQETTADLDDRAALAAEIDALRNGVTSEQVMADQQALAPNDVAHQPQQPVQESPRLSDHERMTKALQENPQLLAGVEAAIWQERQKAEYAAQQYAAGVVQCAVTAGAALISQFPELGNLAPQQIPTAIEVVSRQNPARAAAMVDHLKQTHRIVQEAAQVQEQHQQWQAQRYRAAFDQDVARHDQAYDRWVRDQGVTPAEHTEIYNEVMNDFRRQGWTDAQIYEAWNNNAAMRSFAGQQQMFQAAKWRLNQKAIKEKQFKPVPAVQRPGSPLERASDQDYRLRELNKGGGPLSPKEAAALVTARRQAARR